MRDVKSKNYFEQMKGRGTRTISLDDLKRVTPSATYTKDHFVIIDAIGVTKSVKTDSRPLDKKPSVSLKDLLNAVAVGAKDEAIYTTLAGRLARLDKQLTDKEKDKFKEKTDGITLNEVVKNLLDSYDPDKIENQARIDYNIEDNDEPTLAQLKASQEKLADKAASVFNGELNTFIENVRKANEQIIDSINMDVVDFAGWDEHVKKAPTMCRRYLSKW